VGNAVWDLDARSQQAIDTIVFDPAIRHKLVATHDQLSTADVVKVTNDLQSRGLTRAEAGRRIAQAAWILRTQSWPVIGRQLQLSLSSLGFERVSVCCDRQREVI